MSQSSLSRSLRAVAKLIVKVKGGEIKFPSSIEEETFIKTGFFRKFGIKSTIGAIDCTYIAIIAPPSNNVERPLNLYLNRKAFYSINVEAVCDHRLRFTFINAKFPGATYDSGIWATSDLREDLIRQHTNTSEQQRRESWLLGDQGYPLEPWLLTPVGTPNTHKEQKYNKLHGSARNCIERAFGVLKSRFRCLLKHRVLHYSGITFNEIDDGVAEDFDSPINDYNSSQYVREGERTRSRYISIL
ncbi:putative nuclease HARBI1 [Bactrocera neohumeralis]|uniref:putative nuclease HARBI1 n=1 Tax=Bactrocera neohumeralis TaxID=98809 RepID=UPI002166485C|nr:putative nuclease HARBI1 [Bactrocera neohumeralis]